MNVKLTKREQEIYAYLLEGKSNAQIAKETSVSINTVKTHVAHILKKSGFKNRVQIISNQLKSYKYEN